LTEFCRFNLEATVQTQKELEEMIVAKQRQSTRMADELEGIDQNVEKRRDRLVDIHQATVFQDRFSSTVFNPSLAFLKAVNDHSRAIRSSLLHVLFSLAEKYCKLCIERAKLVKRFLRNTKGNIDRIKKDEMEQAHSSFDELSQEFSEFSAAMFPVINSFEEADQAAINVVVAKARAQLTSFEKKWEALAAAKA